MLGGPKIDALLRLERSDTGQCTHIYLFNHGTRALWTGVGVACARVCHCGYMSVPTSPDLYHLSERPLPNRWINRPRSLLPTPSNRLRFTIVWCRGRAGSMGKIPYTVPTRCRLLQKCRFCLPRLQILCQHLICSACMSHVSTEEICPLCACAPSTCKLTVARHGAGTGLITFTAIHPSGHHSERIPLCQFSQTRTHDCQLAIIALRLNLR